MQKTVRTILSTRPVNESLAVTARSSGIVLDTLSFIATETVDTIEVQQEVEQAATQLASVVFTSMNAVAAVTDLLDGHIPDWRIFCIGHATKEQVEDYFGRNAVAGTANNALELADTIIDEDPEEVFFFCGNRRRNELPNQLRKHKILVNEVTVYQTKNIPHRIEKTYDAVLFFSPSAVESFFHSNQLPGSTVVYAIGNTTAEAVHHHCTNRVIKGKTPVKDELVELAIHNLSRET